LLVTTQLVPPATNDDQVVCITNTKTLTVLLSILQHVRFVIAIIGKIILITTTRRLLRILVIILV
jgi:hypothetical protein